MGTMMVACLSIESSYRSLGASNLTITEAADLGKKGRGPAKAD
jgi:hypothetical protein